MLDGDQLVVSIGVLRDLSADLPATAGVKAEGVLAHHLPEPIVSASAAQASVATLKKSIDAVVARHRPAGIKLFMAAPAAFAVALGHRSNALPPTVLHEFRATDRLYVATLGSEIIRKGSCDAGAALYLLIGTGTGENPC